jgi:hypothetical protein
MTQPDLTKPIPVTPTPPPGTPTPPQSGTKRWARPIRIAAATIAGIILAGGTLSVVGYFIVDTKTTTTSFTEAVTRVHLVDSDGRVVIRTGTAAQGATVTAIARSSYRTARHTEKVSNGVLEVNGGCRGGMFISDSCSMGFEITVPRGTIVDARTTTGNISVTGTGAEVTARSNTGNLRVTAVGKPVRLSTEVGDVSGTGLPGGTVLGQSNTGDVRLTFTGTPDRVTATTDVGDVQVVVPDDATGYRINADTDIGNRDLNVPRDPRSKHLVELHTNTGDISMGHR